MAPQKKKKRLSAGCSPLRAGGFSCGLDILLGDLGIITVGAKSLEAAVSIGPLFRRKFKYNY
jgi:hypothetical protein